MKNGKVQPWRAHYDERGRQVRRTDSNDADSTVTGKTVTDTRIPTGDRLVLPTQEGAVSLEILHPMVEGEAGARAVHARPSVEWACMTASFDTFFAFDLGDVRAAVLRILESPTISGELELNSDEGEVRLSVEMAYGKGFLTLHVEPWHASDSHADLRLTTDQTNLRDAVRTIDALVSRQQ